MMKVLIFFCGLLAISQARVNPLSSRIVNGRDAKPGEVPYQVSLQTGSSHFCGGSILCPTFIITAAHCVYGMQASEVSVAVGSVFYKEPTQKFDADYFLIHQNYTPSDSNRNDIALVKIKGRFQFNEFVTPVKLPEQDQFTKTDAEATVSGWGYPGFGSYEIPQHLQVADIHVADPSYCTEVMKGVGRDIYDTNICAYDPKERRGQCNGDSGGPLTVDGKQVGIVSWSIKDPYCASTKYPGVYTRLSKYVDWINEQADPEYQHQ